MRWNWDFLRGKKIELDNRHPKPPPAEKSITVNGHARQIDGADLSDMQVAGRVRMLIRGDLDHSLVCELARDRIVYLADRLGEIEALTADDIGRALSAASTEWRKPSAEPHGFDQSTLQEIVDRDRQLHAAYGAAVLALITGKPPAPQDSRDWFDRTTPAGRHEEQRTRDGYHRHRLKGTEAWTEGRPAKERVDG